MASNKRYFFSGLSVMLIVLALLVSFQAWSAGSEESELRMSELLGSIHQYDTLMTLSTTKMLATRQPDAEKTYRSSLHHYEQRVGDVLADLPEGGLRQGLHKAFNLQLQSSKLDLQAMSLCRQQRCDQAHALLAGAEYQRYKLDAALSLESALRTFQLEQREQNTLTQHVLFVLELVLALNILVIGYFWHRSQISQLRFERLQRQTSQTLHQIGLKPAYKTLAQGATESPEWQPEASTVKAIVNQVV